MKLIGEIVRFFRSSSLSINSSFIFARLSLIELTPTRISFQSFVIISFSVVLTFNESAPLILAVSFCRDTDFSWIDFLLLNKLYCNSAILFLIESILPETLSKLKSAVSFWIRLYKSLFETASLALPGFPRFVILLFPISMLLCKMFVLFFLFGDD